MQDLVEDRLIAVPGVADLQVNGARERLFRVDLDPMAMASRGLTLAEVREALADAAFDTPAGELSSRTQNIAVRTTAALATPAEFEALALGDDVRLGDVASVTLGPDPGDSVTRANGETGIGLGIAAAGAVEHARDLGRRRGRWSPTSTPMLPEDVSIFVSSDEATFIEGAIHEVVITLALSVLIVVAVIYAVPARPARDADPGDRDPGGADRHGGGDLPGRVLAQHPDAARAGARDRAGGRRRDRGAGEHRAAARPRAWGRAPPPCSARARCSSRWSRRPRRWRRCSCRYRSCPGQAGGLFREFGFTLAMAVVLSVGRRADAVPDAGGAAAAARRRRGRGGAAGAVRRPRWRRSIGARCAGRSTRRWWWSPPASLFAATAWMAFGDIRRELTPPEDRAVALASVSAPAGRLARLHHRARCARSRRWSSRCAPRAR